MPELQQQADADVDALVGQIADEFTQRLERGEEPTIDEYAERHPEIAGLLRDVLRALRYLRRPEVESAIVNADPFLGMRLGDFRLLRQIGAGGMGIVYEAEQSLPKRKVAVKILAARAALDERLIKRFETEAEAAGNLCHPHIVPVHCVGCDRGIHYYAMQLVDGVSLADIIREIRRREGLATDHPDQTLANVLVRFDDADTTPVAELTSQGSMHTPLYFDAIARLGMQAAEGLAHAHQFDTIHRDIKPANLLVDQNCSLWITDFGLAQMREDAGLTRTGELVGTLRYMSPEQTLAKRLPVDYRTDIYSLGATLYELLTLESAFRGSDRQDLLRRIAFDDPVPPRKLDGRIPRDLETIVMTAMAKAPNHRYASAREMADDLQSFLNREPIKKKPETLLRRLWRKLRQRLAGVLLGLAAVIATAILVAVLVASLTPGDRNVQPTPNAAELEKQRQEQAWQAISDHLDSGKPTVLFGPMGRPAYYCWRSDDKHGKIVNAADGAFSVQHWEQGLVELAPDPRRQKYRFSVDVRLERQLNQQGESGIFFCYSKPGDDPTKAHYYCTVAFNDLIQQAPARENNKLMCNANGKPLNAPINMSEIFIPDFHIVRVIPVDQPRPWHRVSVEVRPESIKIFWEGKHVATTTHQNLLIQARSLTARPDQPWRFGPKFEPRGGLGLFVNECAASFQNAVVEPID